MGFGSSDRGVKIFSHCSMGGCDVLVLAAVHGGDGVLLLLTHLHV